MLQIMFHEYRLLLSLFKLDFKILIQYFLVGWWRKSWCLAVNLGLADFWLSVVPEFEALQIGDLHFWLVGVWWDG